MKKSLLSAILMLAIICITSCAKEDINNPTYEIAIVADKGEFFDRGFNYSAYEGIKKYAEKNKKSYTYYQPGNGANATDQDRLFSINQAIENGAKIVILPGASQTNALITAAKENPKVKFVLIDGENLEMENVTSVSYKEEEAGFLAGYAAVMEGYTKLGGSFGGGGTIAACNRFAYGYVQGANTAAKEKEIVASVKISYQYGSSFSASEELEKQMSNWYENGTEVVFSCGGSMFQSVKDACAESKDGRIIGVDIDRANDSNRVITSAMKGVADSVEKVLDSFYSGKWDAELAGKCSKIGAKENAIGFPTNNSSWRFTNFTIEQYNELFNRISMGTIEIQNQTPADMNSIAEWNNINERLTNIIIEFE